MAVGLVWLTLTMGLLTITPWVEAAEVALVLATGLGNPAPYSDQVHAAGGKVVSLVGNVKNARRVSDGGADVVVAQGHDAGGHTGRIGTAQLRFDRGTGTYEAA